MVAPQHWGTIESADGREIYYHRNGVVDGDFDALEIVDEVWFAEEAAAEGSRASSVQVVGRQHRMERNLPRSR